MTMRPFLVPSALATAFTLAIATLPIDQANATFKPIGSYSTNALKSACGAAGGTFGTGWRGEHYCQKGGNLIDCNGKNKCIGGTPRRVGTPVTGGPTTTGKATTYPSATARSFVQGAPASFKPVSGRYHR
jgi:hypothetical protein